MLQESKTNELEYQRLSKEEMDQRGILGRLVGICADFISPTRNGRKYPEKLWENVFNDPIMKERIDNGVCYGELGHPADREETDMEKICVCLAEQPKKGKDGKLRAVFDILNTPNGRILKSLCDYGSTLGISSRGSGDLEMDYDGQESVNPDTYNCEGFDIVLVPAVKAARLQYVTESLHLNEGAINPKHKINLEAREFNYTMQYGTDSQDIHSAVVVIPNGLKFEDGSTIDATVHCEDVNGKVIDFASVKEAQEWIDNYGDSCLYYVVNGDELHATPKEAYDIDRAIALESIDLNKKRYNKTLREKLTESIKKETEENQRVINESLSTLGMSLNEAEYTKQELLDKFGTTDLDIINAGNEETVALKDESTEWVNDQELNETFGKHAVSKDSVLAYCENLAKDLPQDKFAKETRKNYIDIVYHTCMRELKPIAHEENGKQLVYRNDDKNEYYFSTEFISSALQGDLAHWFANEVSIGKNAPREWQSQVDDYIINEFKSQYTSNLDESVSLDESTLTPEEKMDLWHAGERKENIKACGDAKLYKYREICKDKNYVREVLAIDAELQNRGLDVPEQSAQVYPKPENTKPTCVMRDGELHILFDNAGKDFISKYTHIGNIERFITGGKEYFVVRQSDPFAEDLAKDLIKVLNENYLIESLSEAWGYDIKLDENLSVEQEIAAEDDGAMMNNFQQLLSTNQELQEKIVSLQEKLSVSYAKEMSLTEELSDCKETISKLSETANKNIVLSEQLTSTKNSEQLLTTKCKKLSESIDRKNIKLQQVAEQLTKQKEQIQKLQEQLKVASTTLVEKENIISDMNNQYEVLNENYQQMKANYSKKIESQNALVEKYRNVAVKSVNKYIDTQATRLGIKSSEIKNRLPESYSFKDIDEVCNDLQEYNLNISTLPFNAGNKLEEGLKFKAQNIDNRVLIPTEEDLDDLTLRLAGL